MSDVLRAVGTPIDCFSHFPCGTDPLYPYAIPLAKAAPSPGSGPMVTETVRDTIRYDRACLARAVEMASEAVVVLNGDGRAVSVNGAFERITGSSRPETLGEKPPFLDCCLYGDRDREGVWPRVTRGESWSGRLAGRRKDASPCEAVVSISPVCDDFGAVACLVVMIRDETEQAAVEAQFHQAQKMEAIGRLAAGIAHDFNNQLTVVLGYSDLLLKRLPADAPARKNAEQIRNAAERAGALAGRLLSLGRKHAVQAAPTSLNAALKDIAKSLRRVISEDITLRVLPFEGCAPVEIDRSLLDQAVMNLVINARDAMPQGGDIEIATANVKGADAGHALPPGDYVRLSVRDTGAGIDAETLTHIFDPFFTTKADGHGTGLGLAMVYSFVKQSRGFIYVESEPGKGTTFTLYFPQSTAPVEAPAPTGAAIPLRAGTETVLVTEDDEDLRNLTVRLLHDCGYNVLAARSPQEALSLGREHADAIDVLITDVVMPGMSGPAMAAQFSRLHQETRVLYVSGHARGALAGHGLQGSTDSLLAKPFGYHALAEKVRQIIDGRRAASGAGAPQTPKPARKRKVSA